MRRIPCRDCSQALLVGSDTQQLDAHWPDAHEAEFVICDQPIDITYVRCRASWLYLVAVLDWYSRFVVAWELDQTLAQPFVTRVVESALAEATPEIWNSDQGSHFTSAAYTERLKTAGVRISMDGRGRALDNIFVERLWRSVKYEEVYLHDYATPHEGRTQLAAYLDFYNHRRLHQALDYRTPAAVYREEPAPGGSPQ